MGSMVINVATELTGSNLPPMGYRDPIIAPGTLGLFDFTEPYCNPNADGTLPNGAAFRDLVDGGAGGSLVYGSHATHVVQLAGRAGLEWSQSALAASDLISLGTTRSLYPSKKFAVWLWFLTPAAASTATYNLLANRNPDATNNNQPSQWQIDTGNTNGNNVRMQVGEGTTGTGPFPAGPYARDTVNMILVECDPGAYVRHYKNGVYSAEDLSGVPATLQEAAASVIKLTHHAGGRLYRFGIEDTDVSGRSAAAIAAAEWALKPFAQR